MSTTRLDDIRQDLLYGPGGRLLSTGPRCVSCGDLATYGEHRDCRRDHGSLLVLGDWLREDREGDAILKAIGLVRFAMERSKGARGELLAGALHMLEGARDA
jgi:hypothetical protein